jgi:predicted RNA-binding Zn ribbon-like protein
MEKPSDFPLLGEPLAVDLVNTVVGTRDGPHDLLASPGGLDNWLQAEAHRLPPGAASAAAPSRDTAVQLREALRALFRAALEGAAPESAALAVVNEASAAAPPHSEVVWDGNHGWTAQEGYGPAPSGAAVLAAIARSGIALLGGPDRDRLRACGGPGCVLLFVARNPRRRWCAEQGCGNRVRVARHYRRHR